MNAILLLSEGKTVKAVSALLAAARSSVGRWIYWYTECGIEGWKVKLKGHAPIEPSSSF
ncbi:helix-turn-helix domain-containing protein [Vibrio sp. PP-XX7]